MCFWLHREHSSESSSGSSAHGNALAEDVRVPDLFGKVVSRLRAGIFRARPKLGQRGRLQHAQLDVEVGGEIGGHEGVNIVDAIPAQVIVIDIKVIRGTEKNSIGVVRFQLEEIGRASCRERV